MKKNSCLDSNFFPLVLTGLVLTFSGATSLASEDNDAAANQSQSANPSFVSGGVGSESIDELKARAGEFNLKLVFATKSGEYVSGVWVTITTEKGTYLQKTRSEGPWFMAKLPPGDYRITATLAGKAINHQVTVSSKKLRVLDFRWNSE